METQQLKSIPKQVSVAINLILTVLMLTFVGELMDFSHVIATEKDTPYWAHVAAIPINVLIALFLVYKIYPGRNWARWLYLIVAAPNAFVALSVGEVFQRSPLLGAIQVAVPVLSCVIVFLLFFSSGKLWFQKQINKAQPLSGIDRSSVEIAGATHEDIVKAIVPKMPESVAAASFASVDLEESFKQFKSEVNASQNGGWLGKALTILFAIVVVVWLGGLLQSEKPKPKPLETAYTYEASRPLDYRQAMLGQTQVGAMLMIYGEVSQIVGDQGAMIATKKEFFGYSGNHVYLKFESKPQVIDGDIVRILGRYSGTWKYKNVFGADTEVPFITVDYYNVTEPKK
jgi:hypothetical protein